MAALTVTWLGFVGIKTRCSCLWADAGLCQGAQLGEYSIGLDFSRTAMCSVPELDDEHGRPGPLPLRPYNGEEETDV